MMQWMPWGQTLEEFLVHVRSFRPSYPEVLIALGPGGDRLFMLVSNDPIMFDHGNCRRSPRSTRRDRVSVLGVQLTRA